jgi:hypothetical protein
MNTQPIFRKYFMAGAVMTALILTDGWLGTEFIPASGFVSSAEARVGRPRTPRSVAGVARRTTRRVVRRSAIYVAALPGGCVRTNVNGVSVWACGGTYYQSYSGRYVVVYVN